MAAISSPEIHRAPRVAERRIAVVTERYRAPLTEVDLRTPAHQAYRVLHVAFVLLPVLAGIDKFLAVGPGSVLTNWDGYLAPQIARYTNLVGGRQNFMMIVGAIEIAAGILVAIKPKIFAYVVAVWLAAIIANLALQGLYFDVVLRDGALLLGAVALGRLAQYYDRPVLLPPREREVEPINPPLGTVG
jgi:hypothetical protein